MKSLEERIKDLPPEFHQKVIDFVDFLLEKRVRPIGKKLRQDWAGALKDCRSQYTSLELQKKALEWRGD
jgi:mRNA-degrading endonuclease RelE of RelBE toxin-antitoxin system